MPSTVFSLNRVKSSERGDRRRLDIGYRGDSMTRSRVAGRCIRERHPPVSPKAGLFALATGGSRTPGSNKKEVG